LIDPPRQDLKHAFGRLIAVARAQFIQAMDIAEHQRKPLPGPTPPAKPLLQPSLQIGAVALPPERAFGIDAKVFADTCETGALHNPLELDERRLWHFWETATGK
jgi:hypothetical protein